MSPLLRPGVYLGPFDLLSRFGLTRHSGVPVHNSLVEDQILAFVSWSDLAWAQVHAGHLPLWNPYNLLGTPLAFNWQSAVFSPPNLVSYLFPVRYAYTVIVGVKLVIAGTGAYWLGRVLGLGALAAAFGALSFELSGAMLDHYGWATAGVTMWAGWVFAAAWLVVRRGGRLFDVVALAVLLALAVYGGHPETLAELALCLVVFVVVVVLADTSRPRRWRSLAGLGCSVVAAAALSGPLLFPGLQLIAGSARHGGTGGGPLGAFRLVNLLVAGLQGGNYETAAYLGPVVVALAVVALRNRWADAAVKAFTVVTVVSGLIAFTRVDAVLDAIPGGIDVNWNRATMVMALAVAVLAAFGLQALLDPAVRQVAGRWGTLGFAACGAVLLVVLATTGSHGTDLVGPAADVVIGLSCAVLLWLGPTGVRWASARGIAVVLSATEAAFLLATGASFWSESGSYFLPTPAVAQLQKAVGSQLVGLGSCRARVRSLPAMLDLGIAPNANIGFGVHEFAVYDPLVSADWIPSWQAASGRTLDTPAFNDYGILCPAITSAAEARIYGVRYVLEPSAVPGPSGAILVEQVGQEQLFEVNGVAPATLVPVHGPPRRVPIDAPGTPVPLSHPGPASLRLAVDLSAPQLLRLRVTAVPGWHGTLDGRPLQLRRWAKGAMLEALVPPGRHIIRLHYWPDSFSAGLATAIVAAVILLALLGGAARGTRRRHPV